MVQTERSPQFRHLGSNSSSEQGTGPERGIRGGFAGLQKCPIPPFLGDVPSLGVFKSRLDRAGSSLGLWKVSLLMENPILRGDLGSFQP